MQRFPPLLLFFWPALLMMAVPDDMMRRSFYVAGFALLALGNGLWIFRRENVGINERKRMIEDCKLTGDEDKAKRLRHELEILEKRTPIYSRILAVAGLVLLALSFVVHYIFR